MTKSILLSVIILIAGFCANAQVYKGSEGEVQFFSDAPLEDIQAISKNINSAFNLASGEVAVLIPIKSFTFRNGLMQEHFNDSYMESSRFPEATFTGHLSDNLLAQVGTEKKTTVQGTLTVHGVSKERNMEIIIKPDAKGALTVIGKFSIKLSDHKIKIPKIVFKNIAEVVVVSFVLNLKK